MFKNSVILLATVAATFPAYAGSASSARGSMDAGGIAPGHSPVRIVKFEADFGMASPEYFSVEVREVEQLRIAERLLRGDKEVTQRIPSGRLVKEPSSVNPGYRWHVDPEGFKFAEVSGDFCNYPPSYVREDQEVWYFGAYCPRPVKVVDIREFVG
ncbi:BP74-related protein [Streptomyces sp. NPDC001774]